jgi:hypothetical protein
VDDRRPDPRKEITKTVLPESYSPNPAESREDGKGLREVQSNKKQKGLL